MSDFDTIGDLGLINYSAHNPTSRLDDFGVLRKLAGSGQFDRAILRIKHSNIGIVALIIGAGHLLNKPKRIRKLRRRIRATNLVSFVRARIVILHRESGFATQEEISA